MVHNAFNCFMQKKLDYKMRNYPLKMDLGHELTLKIQIVF